MNSGKYEDVRRCSRGDFSGLWLRLRAEWWITTGRRDGFIGGVRIRVLRFRRGCMPRLLPPVPGYFPLEQPNPCCIVQQAVLQLRLSIRCASRSFSPQECRGALARRTRLAAAERGTHRRRLRMLPLAVSWQTAPIYSSRTGQTEREVGGEALVYSHICRPTGSRSSRAGGLMNRAGMIGSHECLASRRKAVSVPGIRRRSVRRHNASERRRTLRPPRSARVSTLR